jgi:heterotetrameric sarcosine oxidase gamma subunit
VSLEFLQPDAAVAHGGRTPLARSPMEVEARDAGARFEVRDGWNVPVAFDDGSQRAARTTVAWVDVSHLGKVEVKAGSDVLSRVIAGAADGAKLEFGTAQRIDGAWWCALTPDRAIAFGDAPALRARLEAAAGGVDEYVSVVDMTASYAALVLVGPLAREAFARFTALDLRPKVTPVRAFRPGSLARTPGFVLREAEDRYLMVVGAAVGRYVWQQVSDAARHLGGDPIGVDVLEPIEPALEEATTNA